LIYCQIPTNALVYL